jgi:HAD superfamily hydrolase (TIGR01509 family)
VGRRAGVALDVDGTLVDSVYQHAVCWQRAFAQFGHDVPAPRVHAQIGKGGDRLVADLVGETADREDGDAIRAAHDALFAVELPTIRALPQARALLVALRDHGAPVVLASSAGTTEIEHYVDLLGARDLVVGWTTSDDVTTTKPDPEILEVAGRMLATPDVLVIGDSPWDVLAADAAGHPSIGVDTGGFGRRTLEEAGAELVVDGLDELLHRVHDEPFVRWRTGVAAGGRPSATG